jgi:Ribose/Galactose Isomerase
MVDGGGKRLLYAHVDLWSVRLRRISHWPAFTGTTCLLTLDSTAACAATGVPLSEACGARGLPERERLAAGPSSSPNRVTGQHVRGLSQGRAGRARRRIHLAEAPDHGRHPASARPAAILFLHSSTPRSSHTRVHSRRFSSGPPLATRQPQLLPTGRGFVLGVDVVDEAGHEVVDFGDGPPKADDDYPDAVVPLARAVAREQVDRGVAVCGSGVGASVVANKVSGVPDS